MRESRNKMIAVDNGNGTSVDRGRHDPQEGQGGVNGTALRFRFIYIVTGKEEGAASLAADTVGVSCQNELTCLPLSSFQFKAPTQIQNHLQIYTCIYKKLEEEIKNILENRIRIKGEPFSGVSLLPGRYPEEEEQRTRGKSAPLPLLDRRRELPCSSIQWIMALRQAPSGEEPCLRSLFWVTAGTYDSARLISLCVSSYPVSVVCPSIHDMFCSCLVIVRVGKTSLMNQYPL